MRAFPYAGGCREKKTLTQPPPGQGRGCSCSPCRRALSVCGRCELAHEKAERVSPRVQHRCGGVQDLLDGADQCTFQSRIIPIAIRPLQRHERRWRDAQPAPVLDGCDDRFEQADDMAVQRELLEQQPPRLLGLQMMPCAEDDRSPPPLNIGRRGFDYRDRFEGQLLGDDELTNAGYARRRP